VAEKGIKNFVDSYKQYSAILAKPFDRRDREGIVLKENARIGMMSLMQNDWRLFSDKKKKKITEELGK
jgi:hypothetical protein